MTTGEAPNNLTTLTPVRMHVQETGRTGTAATGTLAIEYLRGALLCSRVSSNTYTTPVYEALSSGQIGALQLEENLLLNELRSMSEEIKQLKAVVVKNEHRPLSKKVKFDAGMLTRAWLTPSSHIFRSANLGKELQKYVVPARGNSHSLLAVDFFRKILKNICVEPIHIWKYAVRVHGISRNNKLCDLPEELEEILIGFTTDALGLNAPELDPGMMEQFRGSSNSFWLNLGLTEERRTQEWLTRAEARNTWPLKARTALSLALNDLREYYFCDGKLVRLVLVISSGLVDQLDLTALAI
ncbi:hypothetical protein ANCCAN_11829 [Ancylostoma caninum]|uniref:Uncharacterized protein n=1 Tax=Ancylostoma caninum TaxID=29170 RepID=A0A368GCV0_ANCCA|nr:hypothetical protein ANCCAN_11829 [Ancylostoma caninum]